MEIKFGDIVAYRENTGYALRSGCSVYSHAIVVQKKPLVLVSEEADMRWETNLYPDELEILGKADTDTLICCMKRL